MFSYYAKWLLQFLEKIKLLILGKQFPVGEKAPKAFMSLKNELTSATLQSIDENVSFVISSDNAISALLNQHNRPVAFSPK